MSRTLAEPPYHEMLPGELHSLDFDFAEDLEVGETIGGTPSASLYNLTTDTSYATGLSGTPTIMSASVVRQKVTTLLAGNWYELRITATVGANKILGSRIKIYCPALGA